MSDKQEFLGEEFVSEKLATTIKTSFEEYKNFALKGQMVQLAVAFILGAAFNSVVTAISQNLIMPVIGFMTGAVAGNWREMVWKPMEGLAIETGAFAGALVDFGIISLVLFIVYVKILKPHLDKEKIIEVEPEPEPEPEEDEMAAFNWASKEELIAIKGIGEKTAEKICADYPYESLEHLKEKADLSSSVMSKIKKWMDER